MKLARIVPLLLLCIPAAAGAQGGVEGQEALEMKCVYAALSDAERALLARVDGGHGAAGELDQANDLIQERAEACAQAHGWDAQLMLAGGGFAIARVVYEHALATLPAGLSPAVLDAAAESLSDEDRYRFTSSGKAQLGADPGWSARVAAALSAAGVAEADRPAAMLYLEVLHDGLYAMQTFHELWLDKERQSQAD
jgi:hypothetical protein